MPESDNMAESSNRRLKSNHESPADEDAGEMTLDRLSSEVIATIMTKLDVSSICAITLTCKTFRLCAQDIFKFLPNFHLLEVAAPIDRLRRLLLPNASLRSLKLDCRRLNESSIDHLLQPGLIELSLRNCYKFSGKLLSEVGARCKDLRSLYVSSVADNRGHLHDVCDLEELLRGCTQLEVEIGPLFKTIYGWAPYLSAGILVGISRRVRKRISLVVFLINVLVGMIQSIEKITYV